MLTLCRKFYKLNLKSTGRLKYVSIITTYSTMSRHQLTRVSEALMTETGHSHSARLAAKSVDTQVKTVS